MLIINFFRFNCYNDRRDASVYKCFELDAVHFLFVIANSFTPRGVIRGDFHAFFAKLSNFPDRCAEATTKTRGYLADISQRGFSTNKNKYLTIG